MRCFLEGKAIKTDAAGTSPRVRLKTSRFATAESLATLTNQRE